MRKEGEEGRRGEGSGGEGSGESCRRSCDGVYEPFKRVLRGSKRVVGRKRQFPPLADSQPHQKRFPVLVETSDEITSNECEAEKVSVRSKCLFPSSYFFTLSPRALPTRRLLRRRRQSLSR